MSNGSEWAYRKDYGPYVQCIRENKEYAEFRIEDPFGDGEGRMTEYVLFPGVHMILYDIHMDKAVIDFDTEKAAHFLDVNYCNKGGVEIEVYKNLFTSILKKEACLDRRIRYGRTFTFPTGAFVGVNLSIKIEEAQEELKHLLGGLHIDTLKLFQKLCPGEKPYILRDDEAMVQIMEGFFYRDYEYMVEYYRVKFLEMMMYLGSMKPNQVKENRRYQNSYSVSAVKAIHALITTDLGKHYTMNQLSERFEIPLTAMKACFKEVYGDSIYSYTRRHKMNHAAHQLEENQRISVLELSKKYGYDAPTKFTEAFRKVMGMTPTEYKKIQNYIGDLHKEKGVG